MELKWNNFGRLDCPKGGIEKKHIVWFSFFLPGNIHKCIKDSTTLSRICFFSPQSSIYVIGARPPVRLSAMPCLHDNSGTSESIFTKFTITYVRETNWLHVGDLGLHLQCHLILLRTDKGIILIQQRSACSGESICHTEGAPSCCRMGRGVLLRYTVHRSCQLCATALLRKRHTCQH